MDPIIQDKKILREQILQARSELSHATILDSSTIIMTKIEKMDNFITSNMVMCYIDFGNEVKTKDFIRKCLALKKRTLVPIILKYPNGRKEMKASELYDLDNDVESGTMGILEPKPDHRRFIDPAEIDFFVVPGLAFDKAKNRLGYGAGFHDIMFKLLREDCITAAVSFDFQVFDRIPVKDYDIPVKLIVTESQIIA